MKTAEQFATDTMRYLKTAELIRRLAEAGESWEDEDIGTAIEKTGSMPFSNSDVEYIRFLRKDEYYQEANRSLAYLYRELAACDKADRIAFYKANIEQAQDAANKYREVIRRQISGLVFYETV